MRFSMKLLNKKQLLFLSTAMLFAACGDETTQVVQDNMAIVATAKELPKCTKDNEGAEAFVKGETSERICIDGKWTALASSKKDTVVVKDTVIIKDKSSCTTKELKDKSGVKIVCNGDSVGVVLNGKNGKDGATGAAGKDGKDGAAGKNGASCTVVTLADNSGLKVVCGGDSVGVVLNGEKGDKGDPGAAGKDGTNGKNGTNGTGCSIAQDEKKITITCGDKSSTINLSDIGTSIADTAVVDTEKVAISLDSLAGYTQKGPFIKGSTVYLYELMDGRSLKQTNGNFTSNITRDDGRFKFSARDLVSQYVMLLVDGNYRNEVTGNISNGAIKLKAYSDMRRHATGTVNVNILTHLEFDRVYYLVTHEKMTMKEAKRQAQQEIRKQFHINLSDNTDAEDLDVFGKTDADAALLAISILLQGDSSETALTTLLTEISNDMAEDGKWDNDLADSIKAAIADWAQTKSDYYLGYYRNYVKNWGLSTTIPYFEKFVRLYWSEELGLGVCGSDSIPVGYVKNVTNPKSKYYAPSYTDTTGTGGKRRFICVDADSARWREAYDIEKDTMGWHPENKKDGALLEGPVTKERLVWDKDSLRYASKTEIGYNWGCTSYNEGDSLVVASSKFADYISVCISNKLTRPVIKRNESLYEKIVDPRDNHEYYTIKIGSQTWFAENLNYDYKVVINGESSSYKNSCGSDSCSVYGRYYTWAAAVDSVALYKKSGIRCGNNRKCELTGQIQGVCPDGWHLPNSSDWQRLFSYVGGQATASSKLRLKTNGANSGNDAYGFTALLAGTEKSATYTEGTHAGFWASDESDYDRALAAILYDQKTKLLFSNSFLDAYLLYDDKYESRNIRCVKDSE